MKRFIPLELLIYSLACVKWGSSSSQTFKISSGVRQGSVLSPFLFAVYVNDIGKLQNTKIGTFIILYADDVLLLARSVTTLQKLLWASFTLTLKVVLSAYRCQT